VKPKLVRGFDPTRALGFFVLSAREFVLSPFSLAGGSARTLGMARKPSEMSTERAKGGGKGAKVASDYSW
jgi:hypothetical protein